MSPVNEIYKNSRDAMIGVLERAQRGDDGAKAQIEAWGRQPNVGQKLPTPVVNDYETRRRADDPTAAPEYRKALETYVRQRVTGVEPSAEELRTLSVSSDGQGGYGVSEDVQSKILARMPMLSQ